jgi:centrin-1
MLDENKDGAITVETLKKVVQDLGDNIEESELREMIERADLNGDGIVSQEEFYLFMADKTHKQGTH